MEILTEEIKEALIRQGVPEVSLKSKYVIPCLTLFAKEGERMALAEVESQRKSIEREMLELQRTRSEAWDYRKEKEAEADRLLETAKENACDMITKALEDCDDIKGELTDQRAKETVKLYAKLIRLGVQNGAEKSDAVRHASYMVYAYLGGTSGLGEWSDDE